MDDIIVSKYEPLVFPQKLNAFPTRNYLKYLPSFNGEEEFTSEEHLVAFVVLHIIKTLNMQMCG